MIGHTLILVISSLIASIDCELCPLEHGKIQSSLNIHSFSGSQPSGGITILSNEPIVYSIDSGVVKRILTIDNQLVLIIFNKNIGYVYKGLISTNKNVGDAVLCGEQIGVLDSILDKRYFLYFETWLDDEKSNPISHIKCN